MRSIERKHGVTRSLGGACCVIQIFWERECHIGLVCRQRLTPLNSRLYVHRLWDRKSKWLAPWSRWQTKELAKLRFFPSSVNPLPRYPADTALSSLGYARECRLRRRSQCRLPVKEVPE